MKKVLALVPTLLCATAFAENSALKPGLWETRMIHQVMDGRDMTAQMAGAQSRMQAAMANMSPAQRQQVESMMKGRGMGAGGGATRICISPEMASRNTPMVDPKGHCAPAKVSHSGNTTTFDFDCTSEGRHSVGHGQSVASGDTIHTTLDMTMTDARGTHRMQSESEMSYLGAESQGIKPIDQIAKELRR
jgi:hypothetical protein